MYSFCKLLSLVSCRVARETAVLTNAGRLLERRGKEFLGSRYKDPINSFSDFQEFSVSNPEVGFFRHQGCLSVLERERNI